MVLSSLALKSNSASKRLEPQRTIILAITSPKSPQAKVKQTTAIILKIFETTLLTYCSLTLLVACRATAESEKVMFNIDRIKIWENKIDSWYSGKKVL